MMICKFLAIFTVLLAVLAAARFVPGVVYSYEPFSLIKIALILALANALLKPALKLVLSPLILITLGLFTVIINIFLVWLTAYFAPELSITGFWAYLLTTVIVSIFNFAVSIAPHGKK